MSNGATQSANAVRSPLDPMFPQLVKEADSPEQKVIGFIAFGLYEEARREWASDFRDREGRYPVEDEFRAYERSWTASRLDAIRNAAVQVVAAYADTVSNQLEAEILRRALKGRFWRSVGRWLFSALIYTLAVLGTLVAVGRVRRRPDQNDAGFHNASALVTPDPFKRHRRNRRRFLPAGKLTPGPRLGHHSEMATTR